MNPLQELHKTAKRHKKKGIAVISTDLVLRKLRAYELQTKERSA